MFTKQTNVYTHVMFKNKTNVYKTNVYKTNVFCYVYKTKYKTESLQNKTKVHTHVMFTKQKFTHELCLQNKTQVYIQVMFIKQVMFTKQNTKQKFTNTLCLQNKTNIYNTNVYKTKVYKTISLQTRHVFKTKQNEKQNKNKMLKALCHFTTFSVFHRDHFFNFTDF